MADPQGSLRTNITLVLSLFGIVEAEGSYHAWVLLCFVLLFLVANQWGLGGDSSEDLR